jgi:hypothetical protein
LECDAWLGAVEARGFAAAAFRGASSFDRPRLRSAQYCCCVMAKKTTLDLPGLAAAFVKEINSNPREKQFEPTPQLVAKTRRFLSHDPR